MNNQETYVQLQHPLDYTAMPTTNGVSKAPYIATEIMHDIFSDMDDVEFYMDDIRSFSNSWEEHLALLEEVLDHLESVRFTINPLKCEWKVSKTDFIRHWLTLTGMKP